MDAVKIGMLSTSRYMEAVAEQLNRYHSKNIVVDLFMYAKNGCPLMEPAAVDVLIKTILPLLDVLTPNIPETEKIAGMRISCVSDMEAAAGKMYAMGG